MVRLATPSPSKIILVLLLLLFNSYNKIFLDKRACNNNIQHFWKYREEARHKRATLENKKCSFNELQQKLNSIDKEIIPLEERYEEIMNKEEHFFSLKNKLLTSEGNLKSIRLAIKDLKLLIKLEFKGNDSDLDEALENFNNNLV